MAFATFRKAHGMHVTKRNKNEQNQQEHRLIFFNLFICSAQSAVQNDSLAVGQPVVQLKRDKAQIKENDLVAISLKRHLRSF